MGRFVRGFAVAGALSLAVSCSKTATSTDGAASADGAKVLSSIPPCAAGVGPAVLLVGDPSTPPSMSFSIPGFAQAVLADATGIYIGAGSIIRAPLEGGSATKISASSISVSSFAVVGSFLWVAGEWGVPGLQQLPIQGPPSSFGPAIEGIRNVAGSADRAFYTQAGWADVLSYGNDLVPGPVIQALGPADLIAISGNDVFLATTILGATNGRIERGSTDGGPTSIVATSTSSIVGLAANTSSFYWVESGGAGEPRSRVERRTTARTPRSSRTWMCRRSRSTRAPRT